MKPTGFERGSREQAPRDPGKELVAFRLPPESFLKEMLHQDQSFTDNAGTIELLTRPEVSAFLDARPRYQLEYHNLLSVSYFHRGKDEALLGENGAAAASFSEALKHARVAESHGDEGYRPWTRYVEATLAYFESDLGTLREVHGELEDSRNREIIGNLIRSLETDGKVDYRLAYL